MHRMYFDRSKPRSLPFRGTTFRRCRIIQPLTMLEEVIPPLAINHSGNF
jgi:hypothetical protein